MSPRLATFMVFGVNGAMVGTWVANIPWLQERLDVGAGAATAATAFTGFSTGMAAARLGGDWLNERFGAGPLLRGVMALVALALGGRAIATPALRR
jgi:hypothetical protein